MQAFLTDEAVRSQRVSIARRSGIDDQHAAAGAHQLQCGRHAGVAAADDDDVVAIG
ncbi:hypothetical protein D9M71_729090 [compost metagenome]